MDLRTKDYTQFVISITSYYNLILKITIDINTFVSTILDTIINLDIIRVDNNIEDIILDNSINRITRHQIPCNIRLNTLDNMVTHSFIPLV